MMPRTEKVVEHLCDQLVAAMSGKAGVVRFSQARATNQTRGISDRRYRILGVGLWFEVKSEKDDAQLSKEQRDFLLAELECGGLAACGGLEELQTVITAIRLEQRDEDRDGYALDVCRRIVKQWEGRGRRGEKKPRKPKKEKAP